MRKMVNLAQAALILGVKPGGNFSRWLKSKCSAAGMVGDRIVYFEDDVVLLKSERDGRVVGGELNGGKLAARIADLETRVSKIEKFIDGF